ncbi:MAG: c-type cytochrome [bacterium]
MKTVKVMVLLLIALGLVVSAAFAGDIEKGKALFNDPKLGTTGKSCGSCHADGAKLEKAAGKDDKALAETVNKCIAANLKGKALDVNSADMQNIVAYMKTLTAKKEAPKKKVIQGC